MLTKGYILNFNIEKSLSKIIIFTFIIIMSSMIFAISYFYVKNTYDNFEVEMPENTIGTSILEKLI